MISAAWASSISLAEAVSMLENASLYCTRTASSSSMSSSNLAIVELLSITSAEALVDERTLIVFSATVQLSGFSLQKVTASTET